MSLVYQFFLEHGVYARWSTHADLCSATLRLSQDFFCDRCLELPLHIMFLCLSLIIVFMMRCNFPAVCASCELSSVDRWCWRALLRTITSKSRLHAHWCRANTARVGRDVINATRGNFLRRSLLWSVDRPMGSLRRDRAIATNFVQIKPAVNATRSLHRNTR